MVLGEKRSTSNANKHLSTANHSQLSAYALRSREPSSNVGRIPHRPMRSRSSSRSRDPVAAKNARPHKAVGSLADLRDRENKENKENIPLAGAENARKGLNKNTQKPPHGLAHSRLGNRATTTASTTTSCSTTVARKETSTTSTVDNKTREVTEPEAEIKPKVNKRYDITKVRFIHDDAEQPSLVPEYSSEIYEYLRAVERSLCVNHMYLRNPARRELTTTMRTVVFEWLIEVHLRFKLLQETLFIAFDLFDRYLQIPDEPAKPDELQLIGATCLWVASKYEEMYAPELSDFCFISGGVCTREKMINCEMKILDALDFRISKPHALAFLRRFSKVGEVTALMHAVGKYFIEAAYLDMELMQFYPSEIAAAASALVFTLFQRYPPPDEAAQHYMGYRWDDTMVYHSGYTRSELDRPIKLLATCITKLHSRLPAFRHSPLHVVTRPEAMHQDQKTPSIIRKYRGARYLEVSDLRWLPLNGAFIRSIREGVPSRKAGQTTT